MRALAGFASADRDFLERLRRETTPQHRAVEGLVGILDPGLTRERYAAWLEVFLAWHIAFDHAVDPWGPALGIGWETRRKSERLRLDLARLGVGAPRLAALPVCDETIVLEGLEDVFGAVYVFEGATMGGRVIARHLQATLGLGVEDGAGFFLPYGPDPEPHWRAFREGLCAAAASAAARDRVIASATATFEAFGRWLQRSRPGVAQAPVSPAG